MSDIFSSLRAAIGGKPATAVNAQSGTAAVAQATSPAPALKLDARAAKQRELTLWQLEYVGSRPVYDLSAHCNMVEALADKAGLTGLAAATAAAVSADQRAALNEQMVAVRIARALTPADKAGPASALRAGARLRVAAAASVEAPAVATWLQGYEQAATLHSWLARRRANGLPPPRTLEQFAALAAQERVGAAPGGAQKLAMRESMRRGGMRAMLRKEFVQAGGGGARRG